MFIIYALIYAGFVAIGLFSIETYKMEIIFGLNLAALYGFGLIIFALALAIVYDRICASREESMKTPPAGGENPDTPAPATEGGVSNGYCNLLHIRRFSIGHVLLLRQEEAVGQQLLRRWRTDPLGRNVLS